MDRSAARYLDFDAGSLLEKGGRMAWLARLSLAYSGAWGALQFVAAGMVDATVHYVCGEESIK